MEDKEKKVSELMLICEFLVKGLDKTAIAAYFRENISPPYSEEGFSRLYDFAVVKMAENKEIEVSAERNKGIARLNMLFHKALALEDYTACLAIQKEINSLLSLKREPEPETLPDISTGYTL
jgi:hypothetical protein